GTPARSARAQLVRPPPTAPRSTRRSPARPAVRYAGVGIRFAAVFLDGILLALLGSVVALLGGGGYATRTEQGSSVGADLRGVAFLAWLLLAFAYYVVTEAG